MLRQIIVLVGKTLTLLVVIAVIAVAGLAYEAHQRFYKHGPLPQEVTLTIAKGTPTMAIAEQLAQAGVIFDPWSFLLGLRINEWSPKAGEYRFTPLMSGEEVAKMLHDGRAVVYRLTFAEGMTSRQIAEILRATDVLEGDITTIPPEGSLLPETWHFSRGDHRADVLDRMQKAMSQTLDTLWQNRAPNLPLKSREEAVILASIVERETGLAKERPLVAAVFLNRLRKGMRLQSDPTVVYGLSDGAGTLGRPIRRSDLDNPHAWNTYQKDGLPPTPIANPGRASLEAVLHPADSDALYFVADGTGGHVFARTLDQHNANVRQWRKIEKEQR